MTGKQCNFGHFWQELKRRKIVQLCVGYVLTVLPSWVYDITLQGIEKTKTLTEIRELLKPTGSVTWKITTHISGIIISAFVFFWVVGSTQHSKFIRDVDKSIAVFPFENMSDGSEFAHLGDAVTDEIMQHIEI